MKKIIIFVFLILYTSTCASAAHWQSWKETCEGQEGSKLSLDHPYLYGIMEQSRSGMHIIGLGGEVQSIFFNEGKLEKFKLRVTHVSSNYNYNCGEIIEVNRKDVVSLTGMDLLHGNSSALCDESWRRDWFEWDSSRSKVKK